MKGMLITAGLALVAGSAMAAQHQEAETATPVHQGKFLRVKAGWSVAGEYIVILKEKPKHWLPEVARTGKQVARLHGVEILSTYEHAFRGFLVHATEAQAQALAEHPLVESVEENALAMASGGTQQNPPWNLDRIDQAPRVLDNSYNYEDAANVHVYVVDTGISEYISEFSPDGWSSRVDTVFNYWNDGNADGAPNGGHGTFVAGIIGGQTYGVAKQVNLHSVKVMSNAGYMTTGSINAGLDWLMANAQTPAVVNLSVNTASSFSLNAAASNLANKPGIVVVSAAGNAKAEQPGGSYEGIDACGVSPNNANSKIIVVGATDRNDVRMHPDTSYRAAALYSNFGSCVDLFAPGVDIESVDSSGNKAVGSGTSFAAPHVTGMAAILLSQNVPAEDIKQRLVTDSLPDYITNPGPNSPNRLLFKRPPAIVINSGVAKSVSGAKSSITNYVINVPAGRTKLTLSISGGMGDADLYVRHGFYPETYVYNCRPLRAGNNETCTFTNPIQGPWFVQLRGYAAYSTTLMGQY
jgi:serine protease